MQRKIKVTMPKSKKQLEHTYTFIDENLSGHTHIYSHRWESIISELWCEDGSIKFTNRIVTDHSKVQEWFYYKNNVLTSDQIHYSTEET